MICGKCNIDKPRFKSEEKLDYRMGHLYIDDSGRRWNGRTCPTCMQALRKKWRKSATQAIRPMYQKRGRPPTPLTGRKCRRCDLALTIERYFYHEDCAPGTDSWDMHEAYEVIVDGR